MCFISCARMIINTVPVSLAYTCVRRQKALIFWDTEKQVTTRGVGGKWWRQPGRFQRDLITPQVRRNGSEMKQGWGRRVNFKLETH